MQINRALLLPPLTGSVHVPSEPTAILAAQQRLLCRTSVLARITSFKGIAMGIYAIGDIHGQADMIKRLIEKIKPNWNDTLVFLGDYINRGPSSYDVVEYLIQLADGHNCKFLMGNHEDMFLRYLCNDESEMNLFLMNGGQRTLKS